MILKSIAMITAKQKMADVSREEIYTKAAYTPVLYLLVSAPALLLLIALALFLMAGISAIFPEYQFPNDFILALALGALPLSLILYGLFRLILKELLIGEKSSVAVTVKPQNLNFETKLEGAFAPIIQQLKDEQDLIKKSLIERRNSK